MAELQAKGSSAGYLGQKQNILNIFDEFRLSTPELTQEYPKPFAACEEAKICSRTVYGKFANHLCNEYIIASGEHKGEPLSFSVAKNYLGIIVNIGNDVAGKTALGKEFFRCLDAKSTHENTRWLHGLKEEMSKLLFQRAPQH